MTTLWTDREFGKLWLARVITGSTQSAVSGVALPVLMYSLTGSAVHTAALAALTAAPYLVFGLLAGAGVLIVVIGPAGTMALDAVSFAVSAVLVRMILRPLNQAREPRISLSAGIREGLEFLWREPTVRLFTALGVGQAIAGGAVSGLIVVHAFRVFDVPESDARIGVLFSALAAGSFAATVVMPKISDVCSPRHVTTIGLSAGVGVLTLLVGVDLWWLAVVSTALWGLTSTIVIVNGLTVRQLVTPDRLQGRVNLVGRMVTFGVGQPTGALAGGVLADALSVKAALVITALPLVFAAGIGWSRMRPGPGRELGHGLK